jgi:multiple sugar transport system substrate-binding protein
MITSQATQDAAPGATLSRRQMLAMAARWGMGMPAALTLLGADEMSPARAVTGPAAQTLLNFVVWSYGVSTIRSNIARFEKLYPGITVTLSDSSWLNYHDTMVTRFVGKTPTDLCYSSDHWLQEWAAAGWLVPLDTYFPAVKQYVPDFFPYVTAGMTYNGHLYGLPYYADTWAFMYNAQILKKAGFSAPPRTWDELTHQAHVIQKKGLSDHPLILLFAQTDPGSIEVWMSIVYSWGGRLFDDTLNPIFQRSASGATKAVQWITDALNKTKILDPSSLTAAEIPVVKAMQSGSNAFTILETYNLAELNGPGTSRLSGQFRMGLMPNTHQTVGYVRFYAMTNQVPPRGKDAVAAGRDFLTYFGGRLHGHYPVVERWAVENGLAFGERSLWSDKAIDRAFGTWGNIKLLRANQEYARIKEGLTKYYPQWDVYSRAELQHAYLRQESAAHALTNMANKWVSLKKSMG